MKQRRRPLLPNEYPHLAAMGARLRELRSSAGLSQVELGRRSEISGHHVGHIERGQVRTRRSTLTRIAAATVDRHQVDTVVDELVELAGPALAPESIYEQRVARRRDRRQRRTSRGEAILEEVRGDLERLVRERRELGPSPNLTRVEELLASIEEQAKALALDLTDDEDTDEWDALQ